MIFEWLCSSCCIYLFIFTLTVFTLKRHQCGLLPMRQSKCKGCSLFFWHSAGYKCSSGVYTTEVRLRLQKPPVMQWNLRLCWDCAPSQLSSHIHERCSWSIKKQMTTETGNKFITAVVVSARSLEFMVAFRLCQGEWKVKVKFAVNCPVSAPFLLVFWEMLFLGRIFYCGSIAKGTQCMYTNLSKCL